MLHHFGEARSGQNLLLRGMRFAKLYRFIDRHAFREGHSRAVEAFGRTGSAAVLFELTPGAMGNLGGYKLFSF
jgi:hypothetical protein